MMIMIIMMMMSSITWIYHDLTEPSLNAHNLLLETNFIIDYETQW